MTRKDYIKIAEAIFKARLVRRLFRMTPEEKVASRYAVNECMLNIADVLAADNSSFNRTKFYDACGLESE